MNLFNSNTSENEFPSDRYKELLSRIAQILTSVCEHTQSLQAQLENNTRMYSQFSGESISAEILIAYLKNANAQVDTYTFSEDVNIEIFWSILTVTIRSVCNHAQVNAIKQQLSDSVRAEFVNPEFALETCIALLS